MAPPSNMGLACPCPKSGLLVASAVIIYSLTFFSMVSWPIKTIFSFFKAVTWDSKVVLVRSAAFFSTSSVFFLYAKDL